MHEFSIAVNIIEIVEKNAEKVNAIQVNNIDIEVGQLSGVVIEALDLAIKQAKKNTIASNARIHISEIKGRLYCKACKNNFESNEIYNPCPKCGSTNTQIINGEELRVKEIEVD